MVPLPGTALIGLLGNGNIQPEENLRNPLRGRCGSPKHGADLALSRFIQLSSCFMHFAPCLPRRISSIKSAHRVLQGVATMSFQLEWPDLRRDDSGLCPRTQNRLIALPENRAAIICQRKQISGKRLLISDQPDDFEIAIGIRGRISRRAQKKIWPDFVEGIRNIEMICPASQSQQLLIGAESSCQLRPLEQHRCLTVGLR